MNNGPAMAKTVWTEADFDAMDWHDNAIHAIAVEPGPDNPGRLLVDRRRYARVGLPAVPQ